MSEEEKKALAFLRFYVSDDEDEYFNSYYISKNIIETILNLISKQQKEIERIEKKLKRYQKYLQDSEKKCDKLLELEYTERERDYISKDKIKEKIELLKDIKKANCYKQLTEDYIKGAIEQLEELLGE